MSGPREIRNINFARSIWNEAKDPRSTIAHHYLKQYRKLELPNDLAGEVLRFHPACPWRDENSGRDIRVPALIAPFRSIDDNAITAIQRVRLNNDGSKSDRRMLGPVARAAIKFDQPSNGELVVGEGLETALAAMQLGFKPTWSLGSCGAIGRFPLIDGIERLSLLGEADTANADAVELCAQRWQEAGRRVHIVMPDDGYSDLNDELMAKVTP